MGHFRLVTPLWGLSEITALGQARFFRRIDLLIPARHRAYAMNLLNTIIAAQRWGIPRVKPPGWRIYFKGGWGAGTGLRTHQVALLRRGPERLDLRVSGGIAEDLPPVPTGRDDRAVDCDHRTDRDVPGLTRGLRRGERRPHEVVVVFHPRIQEDSNL